MRIDIRKIVYPGRRLGLAEGKVVFTDRGLPGESVEVEVFKDRKSYAEARTLRVLEPSPSRVEPRCGHFLACSPYQDMDYGLELEVKRGQVEEIMSRELKRPFENLPVTPSPEVWGYRNRIRLRVWREGGAARFVYNEPGEQESFVTVDRCHLVPDRVNDILARTLELIEGAPFPSVTGVEVRTSRSSGQSLLVCDLGSGAEAAALADGLSQAGIRPGRSGRIDLRRENGQG
jgi:23S rRNA (uracil1939-C5)-methyltransferase